MTVDTMPTRSCPNVFDAGLPILAYEHVDDPEEAHRLVAQARNRAPIAIGTHGPEILRYELVRTVLRDPRFRMPKGMFLAGQGITSGAIWDRVTASLISLDGDEHHRLRRLVSKAFTPRATARLRSTIIDVITELVERQTIRGALRCGDRHRASISDPDYLRAARRTSRGLEAVLRNGPTTSSRPSAGTLPPSRTPSWRHGRPSTTTSTIWSLTAVTR